MKRKERGKNLRDCGIDLLLYAQNEKQYITIKI